MGLRQYRCEWMALKGLGNSVNAADAKERYKAVTS
jgi:hypothetical protein